MNWIIFILIFVSLLRHRRNTKKRETKTRFRQQFIIALTLSLLFGLGWGVGFATTSSIESVPLSATLQAIFILLTGFQGLLIFIMYCVRSEDARNVWKKWIYTATCRKYRFNISTPQCKSTSVCRQSTGKPKAAPNGITASNVGPSPFASSAQTVPSADINEDSSVYKEETVIDEPQELLSKEKDGQSTLPSSLAQVENTPTESPVMGEMAVELPVTSTEVADVQDGGVADYHSANEKVIIIQPSTSGNGNTINC